MGKKRVVLRIDKAMDLRGISTADLAQRAEITYNTALSLRRGAPTRIDLDTLARVCEVLDMHPGQLLDLVEDE